MAAKTSNDLILDQLQFLAQHFNLQFSSDKVLSGLPLDKGKLSPNLFNRAADKSGFKVQQFRKKINAIYNPALPVVLVMNDDSLITLLSIDRKANTYRIFNGKETVMKLEQLEKNYSGQLYMLALKPEFDQRVSDSVETKDYDGHWFWSTLLLSKKIYRDVLIASLLVNIFAVMMPLYIMNVYDRVVPNNATETLWTLSIGIFLVFIFDALIKFFRAYFVDIAGKKSDILISNKLYEHLMGMKLEHFPRSVGSFASQLKDFENIREFIASATILALIDIPFVLLFLLIIYTISGQLMFAVVAVMLIIILHSFYVQRQMLGFIEKSSKASAMKNANLIESLYGVEQIRSSNSEGYFQRKWEVVNGYLSELSINSRQLASRSSVFNQFFQQASTIVVIIFGVSLINDKSLSLGGLIATIMLLSRAVAPISQLGQLITRYHGAKIAFGALDKVMSAPVEVSDNKTFLSPNNMRGNIEIKDLSFAYPSQKQTSLKNVNIKIKAGEKVGIIGKVGSGKTTLFKLLMNYYQPQEGIVKLDGLDLTQIHPTYLRKEIAYVDQNPMIFFGSVLDNIVQGKKGFSAEQIVKATEITDLHDYIAEHPDGLNLQVGEGGKYLSTGQRQCVALASGLIEDKSLILLDEPTSFLDKKNEQQVKQFLKKMKKNQTLIVSTQRFSMLEIVDRIIVFEKGRVVADATKEEILKRMNNNGW